MVGHFACQALEETHDVILWNRVCLLVDESFLFKVKVKVKDVF